MPDEHTAINHDLQTSLMRSQEEVKKLRMAITQIENAVIEERKMPNYHNAVIKRHREEWGSLHNAIEKAINVLNGK